MRAGYDFCCPKKTMKRPLSLTLALLISTAVMAKETLPPLQNGKVPQTYEELWAGYDPSAEPLDVRVLNEWKVKYQGQDITVQLLTYAIGTFKGQVSRMTAYYGFPTGASKVPGLVDIHGGGQSANRGNVEAMAANGYACISINWGANPLPDLKPGEPNTEWGAIDATQKSHGGSFFTIAPDPKTIDDVPSPRNNNWYLVTIAGRRALTFLEQQPNVDSQKLGVFGHSMGGILTTMVTGTDPRVKASVPSVGGSGDFVPASMAGRAGAGYRNRIKEELYFKTVDESVVQPHIKCPILYQGPHNDFNCNYDLLNANWKGIPGKDVHFSISPHFNHRHCEESEFARFRFFDVVLKGEGTFPATPKLEVNLKTADGIPVATVTPESPEQVQKVQVYYSVNPNALTRFWRRAETIREGDIWKAALPVTSTDMPLFVMANVLYPQPKPLIGPFFLPKSPPNFLVSTWELTFEPDALKAAGVKGDGVNERMIQESFEDVGDWFTVDGLITRKLTDPKWRGPDDAEISIEVLAPEGGDFAMTFEVNTWNVYANLKAGKYYALTTLSKRPDWQTLKFRLADIKPADDKLPPMSHWQGITELMITPNLTVKKDGKDEVLLKGRWNSARKYRNLRWVGGSYTKPTLMPGGQISDAEYKRLFQQGIDQSVAQEKKDAQNAAPTPAATAPAAPKAPAPTSGTMAFSAKVVSVSTSSITLKTETGEKTLSMDTKTTLVGFKDASEIKAGDSVGVRADAEGKQALVIRSWPPK